jgi:hypothetical protein
LDSLDKSCRNADLTLAKHRLFIELSEVSYSSAQEDLYLAGLKIYEASHVLWATTPYWYRSHYFGNEEPTPQWLNPKEVGDIVGAAVGSAGGIGGAIVGGIGLSMIMDRLSYAWDNR